MNKKLQSYIVLFAPLLFVLSFVVYWITLSPGGFPGESASLIAYHARLDPFDTLLQPIWGVLVRVLAAIPVGDLAYRLNLFSALCGALSVALLFVIVAQIPHDKTAEEKRSVFSASQCQCLSGLVSALFFAFSIPFWTVSTRAHYLSFEVLFMLFCTALFLLIWQRKSRRLLYLFAVLYGVGMVQSAAFILAAPVFGVLMAIRLWQRDMLSLRMVTVLGAWTLLGFLVIIPAAFRFYLSPAYEWREIEAFHMLLWILVRDQGRTALVAVQQAGWMLILLTTILPWFVVVAVAKSSSNDWSGRVGSFLLHVVVSLLGGILLFNISPSPLGILEDGTQLVFPYLVAAIWFGYVAGYWFALASGRRGVATDQRPVWRTGLRIGWVTVLAIGLFAAAIRNMAAADGRQSRSVLLFADAVVESMGDRTWLLSNGVLDANIYLAAAKQGKDIVILNPQLARIPAYLRYMASLMADERLQGLAQLGLGPVLNEWLETDPDIEQRLAILAVPEIWVETGFYPVPQRALFTGARTAERPEIDSYVADHQAFWQAIQAVPPVAPGRPMHRYDVWLRRHVSKVANNAGVFLEDHGYSDAASEAYRSARTIDDGNLSALMNELSLALREERLEAEELEAELEDFIEHRDERVNLYALAAQYGYVRDPSAYVQQGMAWALSGRLRSAVADVERAMGIVGRSPQLRHMLGQLYMRDLEQQQAGERVYRELLEENPDDLGARLALLRIEVMRGNRDEVRTHLNALTEAGVSTRDLVVEIAILALMEGKLDDARQLIDRHLQTKPEDARAWGMRLIIAQQAGDNEAVERALTQMGRLGSEDPEILLTMARAQYQLGYFPAARETLNRIVRRNARHVGALEQLLRLDVMQGDQDSARRHVEAILTIDSGNPLANYILGTIQAARRDFALAENSIRRSLQRIEMPEALNDLAWLLQLRGAYDEAYPLARRALEQAPRNAYAWSTYGVILMRTERYEEASDALHQALQLQPDNPIIQLNVVELYLALNMRRDASNLLDEVMAVLSMLPEEDRNRALEFSAAIRSL